VHTSIVRLWKKTLRQPRDTTVIHFAAATVLVVATSGAFLGSASSNATVSYPADYRKWAVTRRFQAGPESKVAGFHHYYANERALEGFNAGKFPDGSVIVDELLAVDQQGGNSYEGKRLRIAVMMKDSARYAETGGWGFERGSGDSQELGAPADVRQACYSCHVKQKDHDFVFSKLRK